ncbi:MAG TPA: hypothetical protein VM778_14065 [Gemmatimonadota bacterium]|nr:hypothetical protein [Gemmatimonadota bacterium]
MIPGADSALATAAALGILHGLEPGHGWPVAAVYALARRRRWLSGTAAGAIIGSAHLVSSFAVVAVFALLDGWLGITELPWIERLAGLLLLAMAWWEWRRGHDHGHAHDHGHDHHHAADGPGDRGLWGITVFAFLLGFAHEEEFAILALCTGAASCWVVMGVYAVAVAGMILALTLASIATFNRLEDRLERWKHVLPRISAAILGLMGLLYLFGAI